jgi:hypothetical protein
MALQLALTFGHVHLRFNSAAAAPLAATAAVALPDASSLPTKPKPLTADEHCAICTLIQMAGAAAPAAAASLPLLPVRFAAASLAIGIERKPAASPPFYFQARGPPIA